MFTNVSAEKQNTEQYDFISVISSELTQKCTCFIGDFCGVDKACRLGGCTPHNNKAGLCKPVGGGGGAGLILDLPLAAESTSQYFDAFLEVGQGEGGLPKPEMLERAQSVALPLRTHLAVQTIVHESLKIILGFDFTPQQFASFLGVGQIMSFTDSDDPVASISLVKATKKGVVDAIKNANPALVKKPLQDFWQCYPNYKRIYGGQCYVKNKGKQKGLSTEDCIIRTISNLLLVFLPNNLPCQK